MTDSREPSPYMKAGACPDYRETVNSKLIYIKINCLVSILPNRRRRQLPKIVRFSK